MLHATGWLAPTAQLGSAPCRALTDAPRPCPAPQPPPPALPAFEVAATSNFTFDILNNVGSYTPEVQQKVAAQLAAQLAVQGNQVTLSPPAIVVKATLDIGGFPPGREADVRAGLVQYLGAGEAGAPALGGPPACRVCGAAEAGSRLGWQGGLQGAG